MYRELHIGETKALVSSWFLFPLPRLILRESALSRPRASLSALTGHSFCRSTPLLFVSWLSLHVVAFTSVKEGRRALLSKSYRDLFQLYKLGGSSLAQEILDWGWGSGTFCTRQVSTLFPVALPEPKGQGPAHIRWMSRWMNDHIRVHWAKVTSVEDGFLFSNPALLKLVPRYRALSTSVMHLMVIWRGWKGAWPEIHVYSKCKIFLLYSCQCQIRPFEDAPSTGTISESAGNLLEMQIVESHLEPTKSETLEVKPNSLGFSKSSKWFWSELKFGNFWARLTGKKLAPGP